MTTNVDQIGRWKMYDSETGKEIMDLSNATSIIYTDDMSTNENISRVIDLKPEITGQINCDYINESLLHNLTRTDSYTATFDIPILIQAKFHKKKRINKKWLRRYGMINDVLKASANIKDSDMISEPTTPFSEMKVNFNIDDWHVTVRPDQLIRYREIIF